MDVYSKAWPLLWSAASSPSLRDEGPSRKRGSSRWKQLLRGMEFTSHRSTTPTDPWSTQFLARRNGPVRQFTGQGQIESPNLFFDSLARRIDHERSYHGGTVCRHVTAPQGQNRGRF